MKVKAMQMHFPYVDYFYSFELDVVISTKRKKPHTMKWQKTKKGREFVELIAKYDAWKQRFYRDEFAKRIFNTDEMEFDLDVINEETTFFNKELDQFPNVTKTDVFFMERDAPYGLFQEKNGSLKFNCNADFKDVTICSMSDFTKIKKLLVDCDESHFYVREIYISEPILWKVFTSRKDNVETLRNMALSKLTKEEIEALGVTK